MVSTLFFRSLVSLLLLVSLADAAITLKLEKHHGNARSSNKRSHVPHARSNFVPRAPARGLEGAYNNRSDSLERVKSRPKRQNEEEEARWAALLAQLTPPSDPSSTTASGSGSSDHPASNPAPTYPAESNVGPAKLEEAATPYTPPADTVLYPTTTESTTSTSTVFTDSYPSPTYSLDSSAASPLPSQDISEGPFDDDDGATIPLYSPHDVTYTIVVQVAGQPLNLVIDTGSTLFWVATQSCEDCIADARAVAPISLPANCKVETQHYGLGNVSGCATTADLSFGDFHLPQHALLGAVNISDALDGTASFMSGILGVGLAHGNLIDGDPPLVTLFKQHMDQSPTVGFYIDRAWDQGDSEITLGDVTQSPHVNAASALSLRRAIIPSEKEDRGWYIVNMDSVTFGDLDLSTGGLALLDTGSTNLMMPKEQLTRIYEKMNSGRNTDSANVKQIEDEYGTRVVVRCEKPVDASEIIVTLGKRPWHIPYGDIVGAPVDSYTGFCSSRLSALSDTSLYQYILGGVFLKNVYSSYNVMDGTVTLYDVVQ